MTANPTSIFRVTLRLAYQEIEWDERYWLGGGGSDYGQADAQLLVYLRSFWMAPGVKILFASTVDVSIPRRADKTNNTPMESPWQNSKLLLSSSLTAIAPPNDPFVGFKFRLQSGVGGYQYVLITGVSDDWVANKQPSVTQGILAPITAPGPALPTIATPASVLLTNGAGLKGFLNFLLQKTAYVYKAVVPPLIKPVYVQSSASPPWNKILFRKVGKQRHSGSFRKGKGRFIK